MTAVCAICKQPLDPTHSTYTKGCLGCDPNSPGASLDTLIRKGLTPYQITKSSEWKGGKNLNTVLGYLDRYIGGKVPHDCPLLQSEILYTISRPKREILSKAQGKSFRDSWEDHRDLWSSPEEVQADFETFRRYGQVLGESGRPGERLGYLFEDVWAIERRLHQVIEMVMREKFGEGWWIRILNTFSPKQMERLRRYSDPPSYYEVDLSDLARIVRRNWLDFAPKIGGYASSSPASFKDDLDQLIGIRNGLFHPARNHVFVEDDFELARRVRQMLFQNGTESIR